MLTERRAGGAPALGGSLIGIENPLPASDIQARHKMRAKYLKMFDAGIDKLVAARFLLRADGEKLKAEEMGNPPF